MSKISLSNVSTFQNDTSAVTTVNSNTAAITTAFDNTLSRDGTVPNQMGAPIDMNNNPILNLPPPFSATSPIRFGDISTPPIPVGFPTLTGDVTGTVNTVTGQVPTTISSNVVSNSKLAQAPANTIKGNATGGTANVTDLTTLPTAAFPALTGDVTTSAGSVSTTAASNILKSNTTNTITVGYGITPFNGGTVSSGTFTPSAANGNYQFYTNNGAHTLANPTSDCAIDILVTNGASAGAITFTTFTVGTTGDGLTTVNGSKFIISIRRINAISTYVVKALQ